MTPHERWGQVRDLFERALEQNPVDISAWLAQEGVTDEQLRAEVLSLLRYHTSTGSFLAEPVADRFPDLMSSDRLLEPGQVVGKYSIVRELGRGGMGRVYLATEDQLERPVAIKALAPELARDPVYRERLRREARAAAALAHPGICTIYALEEIGDDLYIVAEFVDGHTLRDEMNADRRPLVGAVVRTARDLAAALASAHDRGIAHRDLKPENVMRTRDGRLKILDFGLARREATAPPAGRPGSGAAPRDPIWTQMTVPGAIMGTPAYMAPEQLNGGRTDRRTDVWAFGVLMYEYASGRHPFDAETLVGMMGRILESDPVPIDGWRQDLPSPLVRVLGGCLRKRPDDRFPSAAELVRELEREAPPRPSSPVATWWRTHQLAVIALYFVACALAWQAKEWVPGIPTVLFFATGIAATVGGVFRGHLLFVERVTGVGLAAERRRASTATLVFDLVVALTLTADGAILASERPLPAVLTIGLGIGIALARLVVEPATTAVTFK